MSDHIFFYIPPEFFHGDQVLIEGAHLRHIKNVLRKKAGDRIVLTDGQGCHYDAQIVDARKARMTAKILEKKLMPRNYPFELTVGFVPVKGLHNDIIIEKGTELGVTAFIAFVSEHAVVKNIGNQKIERWYKIAQSAMAQSRQYYLPEVLFSSDIESMLHMSQECDLIVVADQNGEREVPLGAKKVLLLIGPEGGWSQSEKSIFVKKRASLMSLGPSRLRSETAVIVGVTKILTAYGVI